MIKRIVDIDHNNKNKQKIFLNFCTIKGSLNTLIFDRIHFKNWIIDNVNFKFLNLITFIKIEHNQ